MSRTVQTGILTPCAICGEIDECRIVGDAPLCPECEAMTKRAANFDTLSAVIFGALAFALGAFVANLR